MMMRTGCKVKKQQLLNFRLRLSIDNIINEKKILIQAEAEFDNNYQLCVCVMSIF